MVKGVSFDVARGEAFAIVGESGSGKSTTALALMGLLGKNAEVRGSVSLSGTELLTLSPLARRKLLGDRIALISQDALSSLNPSTTVGFQIAETLMVHKGMSRKAAYARTVELLNEVGIPAASERVEHYPHQFSGGMRQRALIAMGLALEPDLLIADEPTTALDATIKAQILELFATLRKRHGMSVLLITHDMGAVARLADRMLIMYAGRAAEIGDVEEVFTTPAHPYTKALLSSIPSLRAPGARLEAIPGTPPMPDEKISGCPFHPRCNSVMPICNRELPEQTALTDRHLTTCFISQGNLAHD
ncbi:ABC transporter ATP-binding protein [Pokkaliibacter plantistimulans]|uniref:ABC transporter ATP-binding protein n=1 Tax=Pokkaliibacter plantistimulans TaxID=1635171 RepID=UPI002D78177A|nr:ABC transporter ATP-binding protein [Pokkaliibacter plantistimulans]